MAGEIPAHLIDAPLFDLIHLERIPVRAV